MERNHYLLRFFMDTIYEWVNPRIPVGYILFSFVILSVAIVIGMLIMKWNRIKRFICGALLADYYFLVLCSTVICRNGGRERQMLLMPFWKYPDIWNKVDYPADLLEVLIAAWRNGNETQEGFLVWSDSVGHYRSFSVCSLQRTLRNG